MNQNRFFGLPLLRGGYGPRTRYNISLFFLILILTIVPVQWDSVPFAFAETTLTYTTIEAYVFTASDSAIWTEYDLFTSVGVPKGSVAEIIVRNGNLGAERTGGVREQGSNLERKINLHESEGGGYTTVNMLIQTDSSDGKIEIYAEDNTDTDFVLLGYFEGCNFTESFDDLGWAGTEWIITDLSGYGIPPNATVQMMCAIRAGSANIWAGVRAIGSSLDRTILLDEAEGETLSNNIVSMLVKANASSMIEKRAGSGALRGRHHILGWFGSNVEFVEGFTQVTFSGNRVDGVWESRTLTNPLPSSIVTFAMVHQDSGAETLCGLREEASILDRYVEEHEAEGGGETGFMACVTLDGYSKCEIYCADSSESLFFYMGYLVEIIDPSPEPDPEPTGADPSTIATSTSSAAVQYGIQRKGFHAAGRFWAFYSDGTNALYESTTDPADWSGGATSIGACTAGYRFSVWFDGTYVHYVRSDDYDLFYRRGAPQVNGSITWSAVEQTVHDGVNGDDYEYPSITVDTSGYAWIGARYDSAVPDETPYVLKNANNDGTWAEDFAHQLSVTDDSFWTVTPIPLTSGKVYVTYTRLNLLPFGKLYDAGWGAEESDLTDYNTQREYRLSAVADGDDIHIVYQTGYQLRYNKRTYGVGWGANDVLFQDNVLSGTTPILSINTVTGDFYCFWTRIDTDHVYYKKYVNDEWDPLLILTDWIDESADGIQSDWLINAYYQNYGPGYGYIGVFYVTKLASPYNIRFNYITLQPPPPPLLYSARTETFAIATDGVWTDYDLYTLQGVPKGAIAEIVVANKNVDFARVAGVRTDGSGINRYIDLHEAEGLGVTTANMFVKCDETTGLIECFSEIQGDVDFYLLGHFISDVDFTEAFTSLGQPGLAWADKDLTASGVPDDSVVQILMGNEASAADFFAGVRADGSGLERGVTLDEAEEDGWTTLSMVVQSDAGAVIEWKAGSVTDVTMWLLGWFSAGVSFTEGFTDYSPAADLAWESKTIAESAVDSVVAFALVHQDSGSETFCGLRRLGSALLRYIEKHEAEGGASTGFQACVLLDADKKCEVYCEDASEAQFSYTGYFTIAAVEEHFTYTRTFLSTETTTFTTDITSSTLVTEWEVVQIIVDPTTTVSITSGTLTTETTSTTVTCETTCLTSEITETECKTSTVTHVTSTQTTCETETETETECETTTVTHVTSTETTCETETETECETTCETTTITHTTECQTVCETSAETEVETECETTTVTHVTSTETICETLTETECETTCETSTITHTTECETVCETGTETECETTTITHTTECETICETITSTSETSTTSCETITSTFTSESTTCTTTSTSSSFTTTITTTFTTGDLTTTTAVHTVVYDGCVTDLFEDTALIETYDHLHHDIGAGEIHLIDTIMPFNTTDLEGRWGFNEGEGVIAEDTSGNDLDGDITGATYIDGIDYHTVPPSGFLRYALRFSDANGDFVNITYGDPLNNSLPYSVEFWFRPRLQAVNVTGTIVSGSNAFHVYYDNATESIIMSYYDGGDWETLSSAGGLSTGYTYIVCMWEDATPKTKMSMYFNATIRGVAVERVGMAEPLITNVYIGRNGTETTDGFLSGDLDVVRYYNRTLTSDEMDENFILLARYGVLYSVNMFDGLNVTQVVNFKYNATVYTDGNIYVSFSQDNVTWVNAGGLSSTETLVNGSNSIILTGLGWSGRVYYRAQFNRTGGLDAHPSLCEVAVCYSTIPAGGGWNILIIAVLVASASVLSIRGLKKRW